MRFDYPVTVRSWPRAAPYLDIRRANLTEQLTGGSRPIVLKNS